MKKRTRTFLVVAIALLLLALAAQRLLRKSPGEFEPELLNRGEEHSDGIAEFIKVKLFFLSETSRYLQPVYREIEVPEIREELYRKFVFLLLAGDEAHIAPVPGGVQLRSLHFLGDAGMLLLDFSESLAGSFPGGTTAELEFIYFMVDNICYNFREIKKVKFLIGGNESKSLAGHIDLERPFFPDFSWLGDK
jgi:hypothetical protein